MIVVATGNGHKVEEICATLPAYQFCSMADKGINIEIVEDGKTFAENALIKARAVAQHCDEMVLADDSGLAVDALDGAPGIYSARYAGIGATDTLNNEKLLTALAKVPPERRQAQFVCSLALVEGRTGRVLFGTVGKCEGILRMELAGQGGFGYDPLFIPDGQTQSFAQLGEAVKNSISHRAKALALLNEFLKNNPC